MGEKISFLSIKKARKNHQDIVDEIQFAMEDPSNEVRLLL